MPKANPDIDAIDLRNVRTTSVRARANKVKSSDMAAVISGAGAAKFFDSLPRQLKANDLREFLALARRARDKGLPFHWMMGAHVIKVGLAPLVIDMMKRGIVTGVSFNGAGVIHDLELAFFGGTSEDVQSGLDDGSFGMAHETAEHFSKVCEFAKDRGIGLGAGAGRYVRAQKAPHAKLSILATAERLGLPATIHVGIGSDIVAQHPEFSGALVGELSHQDFQTLAAVTQRADRGGIVANIGSAAILPEVFLKALTVARNLSGGAKSPGKIITANFDMLSHYRPHTNVVTRPTRKAGRGFEFIGHHEIMLPLLCWGLRHEFARRK